MLMTCWPEAEPGGGLCMLLVTQLCLLQGLDCLPLAMQVYPWQCNDDLY